VTHPRAIPSLEGSEKVRSRSQYRMPAELCDVGRGDHASPLWRTRRRGVKLVADGPLCL